MEKSKVSEYKIVEKYFPITNYTFEDDKNIVFMRLKDLPNEIQTENIKTEFQLAKAWSDFAKQALIGEYAEAEITCWFGHYEQFGRVMLELMRMSRDKSQEKNKAISAMIPDLEKLTFIAEPTGSEDRTFYRLWFAFIGHTQFQHPRICEIEMRTYNYWGFLMTEATMRVNVELLKLSKT